MAGYSATQWVKSKPLVEFDAKMSVCSLSLGLAVVLDLIRTQLQEHGAETPFDDLS